MKNKNALLLSLVFISLMVIQINIIPISSKISVFDNFNNKIQKITQDDILKVEINITAPVGYTLYNSTPILIHLKDLASNMPGRIDSFGNETGDTSDDIKWDALYVMHDNNFLPSQVDDIDGQLGYSENDELVFQIPENVNIASGEQESFYLFFGTNSNDLPAPYFPEVCKIYDYPLQPDIEAEYGPDMVQESYNIENGILRATALVEAAWSSGGIYELHLLDEQGNSRFNFIKQEFEFGWWSWKYTRFTCVEQFTELNSHATTNPFFLLKIITGPVRAQLVMKSTAAYGGSGKPWGSVPGVYGVATYTMFANLPYLDYSLTTDGPNAASNPELSIQLWNRDYGGGSYSPYRYVYVPGQGYLLRLPEGLADIVITSADFDEPWLVQKLKDGEKMKPSSVEGPNDDKLGYGMIFDDTYFTNSSWGQTELVKFVFDKQNFDERPITTRYVPFDHLITNNSISYMGNHYQQWSSPEPNYSITVTEITESELPFDHISVSTPELAPYWANVGEAINITSITAYSSAIGFLTGNTPGITNDYQLLDFDSKQVVLRGELAWDQTELRWVATNINLSSLAEDQYYIVQANFSLDTITIPCKFWLSSIDMEPPMFWYGDSESPFDLNPPVISIVTQTPMATEDISYDQMVKVSCVVTDESRISSVILSYHNGSWHDISMDFEYGVFTGSIPPQSSGKMIQYKITATDDSAQKNLNTTDIFSYIVKTEISTTTTETTTKTETTTSTVTPGWNDFLSLLSLFSIILLKSRKK